MEITLSWARQLIEKIATAKTNRTFFILAKQPVVGSVNQRNDVGEVRASFQMKMEKIVGK
ncbi:MAG TPA: hypothetical protein VL832_09650 [Puia sp.]|nr:hypothetical protein [Puia sp.]